VNRATRLLAILCTCTYIPTLELYAGDPIGTAFTYEGQLGVTGKPGAGYYDIAFSLYDAEEEGTQIGPTLTRTFIIGSNGVFMATLDFGPDAFNGEARWLELGVRTNGNGAFTTLDPLQQVTPTPYALQAATAGQVAAANIIGTLVSSQLPSSLGLSNMSIGFATITNALSVKGPMVVQGPLMADGRNLTNVPASGISGLTDTIKERLSWVDVVRDFGAVGDGIHDDTTNFQNALNYIFSGPTASNQTLFIPANQGVNTTYRIEGALLIPEQQWNGLYYEGMHIRGEGKGLSRLSFVTPNCAGIVMTNDNYYYKSIIFEDLLFLGPQQLGLLGYNGADNSIGLRIGSYVGGRETYEILVRDCQFLCFATAIAVSNSWNPRFLRNSFSSNSKSAILLSGVHSPNVQDNVISGYTSQDHVYGDKGIWISVDLSGASGGGDDGLFINNHISAVTNAIQNDGDEGIVVLNGHMERCASFYTATNRGVDTVLQGCYILQLGYPDLEAQRPGALNLCADALSRLTMIQVMFDGYYYRQQIDVPSDANNIGYVPPVMIGGRTSKTVRFLGKDKLVLPILSRGTGMTNDSLVILSNTPAAWPVAPPYAGASDIVNSNGLPYLRLSTNGSGGVTSQWTKTNRLGW